MSSPDESELTKLWLLVKEVGTWAAQHPALLGLTFIFAGVTVKATHTTKKVLRPGIQLTNPPPDLNPSNPRFAEWFVTVDAQGLDIPIWVVSIKWVQDVIGGAATLAGSAAVTAIANAIIPMIGSTPIVIIPAALLDKPLRDRYPDQNVFEISFRTSILGSLIWPEASTEKSESKPVNVKDAPSDSVVLIRLGDILIMAGMTMLFGSQIGNLSQLLPKL